MFRRKKKLQEDLVFYKDQTKHLRRMWRRERRRRHAAQETVDALIEDNKRLLKKYRTEMQRYFEPTKIMKKK